MAYGIEALTSLFHLDVTTDVIPLAQSTSFRLRSTGLQVKAYRGALLLF
jgi:hypothetical protein